jgi:hypothetical protein
MGAGLAADGNNDGTVNQADYDLWRANFGKMVAPASGGALLSSIASVPEPTAGILLMIGAVSLSGMRLRKRFPVAGGKM